MTADARKTSGSRITCAYFVGLILWTVFRSVWLAPRYAKVSDLISAWDFWSLGLGAVALEFVLYFGFATVLWIVLRQRFKQGAILAATLGAVSFLLVAGAARAFVIAGDTLDIGWHALLPGIGSVAHMVAAGAIAVAMWRVAYV